MILPFSKLETHPLGTPADNAIITANWPVLEAILFASSWWLKTGDIDGLTAATTSLANPTITADNPSGYKLNVDKVLFIPTDFDSVSAIPQIEVGDDAVGTNSLVAAVFPTAVTDQIDELTLVTPRPVIQPAGSIKVKVDTAGTGTTCNFQIWVKVVAR